MDDEGQRQGRSRACGSGVVFKTCPLWSHSWHLRSNCAPLGMRGRRWAIFYCSYPLWSHNCTLGDWAGPHWGDDIPPLVVARAPSCSCVGWSFAHPWSSLHLPWARGFVRRHPRYSWCPVGRGSHPSPALRQAHLYSLGGGPGEETRPREVAAAAVGDWAGYPSRCSGDGPAAL